MQNLDLTNNKDGAISIEPRTDKSVNVGIGDGDNYVEIILKDDEIKVVTRWLVEYCVEVDQKMRGE